MAQDSAAVKWLKNSKGIFQPQNLRDLDAATLADIARFLGHGLAEVNHYLQVRNRQSAGGLMKQMARQTKQAPQAPKPKKVKVKTKPAPQAKEPEPAKETTPGTPVTV